jgi:cobalt-zinc-cadmium efflux system outer membrane protein
LKTLCAAAALACSAHVAAGSPPGVQQRSGGPPLTFQAAWQLATSRNLGLEAARRLKAIHEARVRIARQFQNPELAFDASRDTPHEAVTLSFPVELGGKRSRRIQLAQAEAAQAEVELRAEIRTLRRGLRQAFYGLVAADERVRLAEEVASLVERVRQVTQARFEEGAAPRLDVLTADLGVARARADVELARSSRTSAQAELNALLDRPAGETLEVAGSLSDAARVPDLAAATALARTSNTDLLAAEQEAAVEERRASLLRAERLPTPTFSIGGVFDAPGEFRAGLSGGVSLAVPLFNRNQGEIAEARAALLQIQAKRDAIRRSVENGVFAASARIDAQRRQVDAYRSTIVPAAAELASLAEESYRLGRNPVLALIEAQRALRDVRREYLQALLDLQSAVADLEEVIGAAID